MTFKKDEIIKKLSDFDADAVEQYATYCVGLLMAKDRETQKPKNAFIQNYTADKICKIFRIVAKDGLFIDGKSITLSSTGVSYDYKAYKNMLLIKYPESIIDHQLVYKKDVFHFSKQNGKVVYAHDFEDPFNQKDTDIVGGYCVIKNRRGEFITIMGKEDIEKCRKVAKTDQIWKKWYKPMCLKTVIKSACGQHFQDIFQNILNADNEAENDVENPLNLTIDDKAKIDEISTLKELRTFYNQNKEKCAKMPDLLKYIQKRQTQLKEAGAENNA